MKIFEKIKSWWDEKCPVIPFEDEAAFEAWEKARLKEKMGLQWKQKARERRKRPRRPYEFLARNFFEAGWAARQNRPKCELGKELDRLIEESVRGWANACKK